MKILVVYRSKTGNTRRYAEYIARELQADLQELGDVNPQKMAQYDVVCYGAGTYAASLGGLKNARAMFEKSGCGKLVLFATGGCPNHMVEDIEAVWHNMLPGDAYDQIPHFYMQAGINYEKMCAVDKTLMKMMVSHLKRKKNPTQQEAEAARVMAASYDIVDFQYAKPLIQLVKDLQNG